MKSDSDDDDDDDDDDEEYQYYSDDDDSSLLEEQQKDLKEYQRNTLTAASQLCSIKFPEPSTPSNLSLAVHLYEAPQQVFSPYLHFFFLSNQSS